MTLLEEAIPSAKLVSRNKSRALRKRSSSSRSSSSSSSSRKGGGMSMSFSMSMSIDLNGRDLCPDFLCQVPSASSNFIASSRREPSFNAQSVTACLTWCEDNYDFAGIEVGTIFVNFIESVPGGLLTLTSNNQCICVDSCRTGVLDDIGALGFAGTQVLTPQDTTCEDFMT